MVTTVTRMVTKRGTDPAIVLFGSTRRRLLGWLYGHPDEAFYLRELLRHTGAPEGAAQRELAALTAAGLLTRDVRGRQVYFQANRDSPVFPEVSSLLTKTTGIAGVIRDVLSPLAPRIRVAFIYGSAVETSSSRAATSTSSSSVTWTSRRSFVRYGTRMRVWVAK